MRRRASRALLLLVLACSKPADRAGDGRSSADTPVPEPPPLPSAPPFVASGMLAFGATRIPAVMENACQGEGCQASYPGVACRGVQLGAQAGDVAKPAWLKPGDTVDVRTDLHIRKLGVVHVKRGVKADAQGGGTGDATHAIMFAPGDSIALIFSQGEGYWQAIYRDRRIGVQEFWTTPDGRKLTAYETTRAETAEGTAPEIATWERVSRDGKLLGWLVNDQTMAITPIGAYAEKWGLECPRPSSR